MRSILRTRTILLKAPTPALHSARVVLKAKKENTARRSLRASSSRNLSSVTPPAAAEVQFPAEGDSEASSTSPSAESPSVESPEEPEKPKKKKTTAKTEFEPVVPQLPTELDVLWTPELDARDPDAPRPSSLPPPELFEEALNNLHVALHPHTQYRATYPSVIQGSPVEPTVALYCPIEGGDYVVDDTVRELARQTQADIITIDAAHLAAGEWGHFGKAANALELPRNPLHFPNASPARTESQVQNEDYSEENYDSVNQMTIIPPMKRLPATSTRAVLPPSKEKVFFDELVNLQSRAPDAPDRTGKPRIIYVRDFPTLAASAASWYPSLLAAVRSRRVGSQSRTAAAPIEQPTAIVFGMSPGLTAPSPLGGGLGMWLRKPMPMSTGDRLPGKAEWNESETADKAREKRLRDRLKKWEKGDVALYDEVPSLSSTGNDSATGQRQEIVVTGLSPSMFIIPAASVYPQPNHDLTARFFRTSVLVPGVRSATLERESRVARRRELNELTIRMAVGAIGGVLEKRGAPMVEDFPEAQATSEAAKEEAAVETLAETAVAETTVASTSQVTPESTTVDPPAPVKKTPEQDMWDNWGRRIEHWSNVRRIADRAVGGVAASTPGPYTSMEPTSIPWAAVHRAWVAQRTSKELKAAWLLESNNKVVHEEEAEEDFTLSTEELIEGIKEDEDLEAHEKRLLHCIVDAEAMPTSFDHVHLPPPTIDAVRTIVSLPLLHPAAFQQGILKQHGMTGCLLFGPPGTGKTLVVKALAKEAGSRMLAVSPSDVNDMYVGEGEKLVKAVFSLARRLSPCVVFIDEIDALFGARMSGASSGSASAHRGVITEFMQEMDGLKSSKDDNIIVIGATNRPFDLDDAVLRRLPRRLLVDLPGEKEREAILRILLRDETLASDIDLKALAKKTESFSGSDLKHLCVSAALDAVKEHVVVPWTFARSKVNVVVPPIVDVLPTEASTSKVSEVIVSPTDAPEPVTEVAVSSPKPTETPADVNLPVVAVDGAALPVVAEETHTRTLSFHNFAQALKEITPSSSESLGSLSDLRKWNDEFGEGRKEKKKQVWGKGSFGFNLKDPKAVDVEAGRVAPPPTDK